MMLVVNDLTYKHPDKECLLNKLSFSLQAQDKAALVGNNGSGKSTLLRILAGQVPVAAGSFQIEGSLYYVPQVFGQFNAFTVAAALGVDVKLHAFREILSGNMTEQNLSVLQDDWTLEERCTAALSLWGFSDISLDQSMSTLSGGQQTRVFLAGISIHQPDILLLDEPSNHLDAAGRAMLYQLVDNWKGCLLAVSHDRQLLNLLPHTLELQSGGIQVYGGNYTFYHQQKIAEREQQQQELQVREKALRNAKAQQREAMERKQKLDARGKHKQEKAGMPRILINTLRNNAERSTAHLQEVHGEKIDRLKEAYQELKEAQPDQERMKLLITDTRLHQGKLLFSGEQLNHDYGRGFIWQAPLNLEIRSGERVSVKGNNGSGKSTLLQILLGQLVPTRGRLKRFFNRTLYIDQEYSLLHDPRSISEFSQEWNTANLAEHEVKIRLNRFLFPEETWGKPCLALSGGERMRLLLCFLSLDPTPPDLLVLDEPTNNLDIQNLEILANALRDYKGTLLLVSHDEVFSKDLGVEREIMLDARG